MNIQRHRWRVAAMTRKNRPADRCSVNMTVMDEAFESTKAGGVCHVIKRATIDHVAVGLEVANYQDTAIWPTHCPLDEAPCRIHDLAAQWKEGNRDWVAKKKRAPGGGAFRPGEIISRHDD